MAVMVTFTLKTDPATYQTHACPDARIGAPSGLVVSFRS